MVEILAGLAVPLLLSCIALAWTVRGLRQLISALKFRIELLEHPERFPPQHPHCRSVKFRTDCSDFDEEGRS